MVVKHLLIIFLVFLFNVGFSQSKEVTLVNSFEISHYNEFHSDSANSDWKSLRGIIQEYSSGKIIIWHGSESVAFNRDIDPYFMSTVEDQSGSKFIMISWSGQSLDGSVHLEIHLIKPLNTQDDSMRYMILYNEFVTVYVVKPIDSDIRN